MTRNALVLPVPPTSNHYWKATAIYRMGKYQGTIYKTKEAKNYCETVRLLGVRARGWLKPFPKKVLVVFHMTWYRQNMRGDLMNREKCVEDALQGVWYHNDSQVKEKHTTWKVDRDHPRVEVWVTAYEEAMETL